MPKAWRSSFVVACLAVSGLSLWVSNPASADTCKAFDDPACGCDSTGTRCGAHWCTGPGAPHHHVHKIHWRRDHYCKKSGVFSTGAVSSDEASVEYGYVEEDEGEERLLHSVSPVLFGRDPGLLAGPVGGPLQAPCFHFSPHAHTYGTGGSAGFDSSSLGTRIMGTAQAFFDGCDFSNGLGGGFFAYGPWADEATCQYGLSAHGPGVVVTDFVWGDQVSFIIGADDTGGPVVTVDPVDGSTSCSTDGSITPGDPATDPTADADDCYTDVQVGSGTNTCGGGGDGGYWVFLSSALVSEGSGGASVSNTPTIGTITA